MKNKFDFKRDKYKQVRGGYSRLLNIFCRKCDKQILVYQKDGPGHLVRLYLDRIFEPPKLVNLKNKSLKIIPPLKYPNCKEVLGVPYLYVKEKRKAFRLFQEAVVKRVRKL